MTVPEDEATPLIGDQRGSSSYTDLPSDGHSPDNDSGEETASELEGKPSKTSGEKVAIIATLLLGKIQTLQRSEQNPQDKLTVRRNLLG